MDAVAAAQVRRMWPVAATMGVFAVFLVVHTLFYVPLAKRYDRALARAGSMGAILDPSRGAAPVAMPPRVYAVLMENSAPEADADSRAQAGTLGAELVQQVSTLATQQRLEIVVAEPGPMTQQAGWNEARAHVRMRGSWAQYLALLDALASSGRLYRVERFVVAPGAGAPAEIELWLSCATLKRRKGTS